MKSTYPKGRTRSERRTIAVDEILVLAGGQHESARVAVPPTVGVLPVGRDGRAEVGLQGALSLLTEKILPLSGTSEDVFGVESRSDGRKPEKIAKAVAKMHSKRLDAPNVDDAILRKSATSDWIQHARSKAQAVGSLDQRLLLLVEPEEERQEKRIPTPLIRVLERRIHVHGFHIPEESENNKMRHSTE
jgi:hypothetical protein